MSGSASGRVQVSSLVKGVSPDEQPTRYTLYIIDGRTLLGTCYNFHPSLPLQYTIVCVFTKNGDWCSLWPGSTLSCQLFYLKRNNFIVFHCSPFDIENIEKHALFSFLFFKSTSRFQGSAFSADKIVVIVILLAQVYRWLSWKGNGGLRTFKTKIVTFWGTISSPIFTRDYFMGKSFRVDI